MLVGSIGYILSLGVTAWAFYTYAAEFNAVAAASKTLAEATAADADLSAAEAALAEATAAASVGGTSCWSACWCSSPRTPSARGR